MQAVRIICCILIFDFEERAPPATARPVPCEPVAFLLLLIPNLIICPPNLSLTSIWNNRLVKEASYYEKEVIENEAKLKAMKDANKDPHDIKKFQEVLGESQMMIPVSITSRDRALDELREYVTMLNDEESDTNDLMTCEWMVEARKLLGLGDSCEGEEGGEMRNEDGEEVDIAMTSVSGLEDGEAF